MNQREWNNAVDMLLIPIGMVNVGTFPACITSDFSVLLLF